MATTTNSSISVKAFRCLMVNPPLSPSSHYIIHALGRVGEIIQVIALSARDYRVTSNS